MSRLAIRAADFDDQKLSLDALLKHLVAERAVDKQDAAMMIASTAAKARADSHPLELIAKRNWTNHNTKQLLTLEALTVWLAEKVNLPYVRIDPLRIDVPAVTQVMTYAYAARFNILAIEVTEGEVTIATAEPFVEEWETELSQILKKRITRVIANPEDIGRYLLEFYSLSRSVRGASSQRDTFIGRVQNLEQLMELGRAGKLDANDQHVVNIVDWLLQYAFEQRASDIHLEPRRDQSNVRFRIDGVMHLVYQVPTPVMAAVASRIKILGRMDVAEKRRPQDGRMKTRSPDDAEVELRLSTMPTAFGEKLVMRIFDPDVLLKNYKELGFTSVEEGEWHRLAGSPHGIILVTGPTGSGKTTTLYSTLKQVARPEINVCSIEDPIELIEPSFNQMQVQHNIGLDFASGVRTLLRQDPDIIMVGEIRDMETAEMATQAALTGHLVFSTLHTNDAPSAITRLLEIGLPSYLINATVLGIMAQRLVRTLCPHCKQQASLDEELWNSLVKPWKVDGTIKYYGAAGCLECRQTGYLGRVGIYEMLPITPKLQPFITDGCDLLQLRHQAFSNGLKPLRLNGAQKVAAGITTIEEVLRVAPPATH
ncbi:MAG: GspE/PulE family protein [Gammaproteobacteria bacterium]